MKTIKVLVAIILSLICMLGGDNVLASSVQNSTSSNSAIDRNTTNTSETTNIENTVANNITNEISRTNTTTIQSVNQINDVTSSGVGLNVILNIILIAVGFVLILLAIAILIRTK